MKVSELLKFSLELLKSRESENAVDLQRIQVYFCRAVIFCGQTLHNGMRWTADQQVQRLILHLDMVHAKIHLISQGCPLYSMALQCRIVAL